MPAISELEGDDRVGGAVGHHPVALTDHVHRELAAGQLLAHEGRALVGDDWQRLLGQHAIPPVLQLVFDDLALFSKVGARLSQIDDFVRW